MNNPCHSDKLSHINRIEGQVRGISKMIEEKRYCIDILNQLKAISSVESKILKTHLKSCINDALKNEKDFDEKVEEIILTLKR